MKLRYTLVLALALYSAVSCSSSEKYKITDHYDGNTFRNEAPITPRGFLDLLKWKLSFKTESWPSKLEVDYPKAIPADKSTDKTIITFVTHASFLIQLDGLNILTDPVWSNRTSPFSFIGPKGVHAPGIDFEKLPKINVVLISHNHYDHMDAKTIHDLDEKFSPLFLVPLANKEKVKSFGARNVEEFDWWETKQIGPGVKVTLTPAQHWSSRTPFDRMKALWGSYYIQGPKEKIYFAGDTGYGPHFLEITKKLGAPDVSLLPIGAYEPRWFMKDMHMNPEDAVLAHLDLQSKFSIGMHFGSFQLTDEAIDTPKKDLEMALDKHKLNNFKTLNPGQKLEF
nr:MBL fold metallo-hydrolase [Bacteriovorax sp. HI3]